MAVYTSLSDLLGLPSKVKNLSPNDKRNLAIGAAVVGAGVVAAVVLTAPKGHGGGGVASITMQSTTTSGPAPFEPVISGKAADSSGNPVPDTSLDLVVNKSIITSVKTDAYGNYQVQPVFADPGNYSCFMKAGGGVASPILVFTVSQTQQLVTSISISASMMTAGIGQVITFSGKVSDQYGKGFGGAHLYIFANNTRQTDFMSNSDGTYSINLNFAAGGTYQIDVSDQPTNA